MMDENESKNSLSSNRMNSKTKAQLTYFLNWIVVFVLLSIAVMAFYLAQSFQEKKLEMWATASTTLGAAVFSLVSGYIGSRLQKVLDRREERRSFRKSETHVHREYLQTVSDLMEQVKRAERMNLSGKKDESDLIRIRVLENLTTIQAQKPSTNNITDGLYKQEIGQAMEKVSTQCDEFIINPITMNRLETAIGSAFFKIREYETIE